MSVLKDVQSQPEPVRKKIFYVIIIILAIVLLFFWTKNLTNKFKEIDTEGIGNDLNIPALQEELKNLPNFDI